jgi:hypothetical protein
MGQRILLHQIASLWLRVVQWMLRCNRQFFQLYLEWCAKTGNTVRSDTLSVCKSAEG